MLDLLVHTEDRVIKNLRYTHLLRDLSFYTETVSCH